jgi:hypothetical protein
VIEIQRKGGNEMEKNLDLKLMDLLLSVLRKKVIPMEGYSTSEEGVLHVQIGGKGYSITIRPNKTFNK